MNLRSLIEARYGEPPTYEPPPALADNPTLRGLLRRRSHRRFADRPVPEDLLATLFAAAFSAPSKSDLQQVSVVRVRQPAVRRRIAGLSSGIGWTADAPVFMVWCGDGRRIRRLADWRGHPFANDHLDAFMNAAVDTGIALSAFVVAAESAGLGCCPVSEVRNGVRELSSLLALPHHVFPVAGLALGWPAEEGRVSQRLPNAVTVHEERYDDADLVEQVAAYDRRREAVERTPPSAQRGVDRFGTSDDYGWSENRTRQYAEPARADFGRYVRAQGFCLD